MDRAIPTTTRTVTMHTVIAAALWAALATMNGADGKVPVLIPPVQAQDYQGAPEVLGKEEPAASPQPHFWVQADYLLWWVDGAGPAGNLFQNPASGFRIEAGVQPGGRNRMGLEAGFLHLEKRSVSSFGR